MAEVNQQPEATTSVPEGYRREKVKSPWPYYLTGVVSIVYVLLIPMTTVRQWGIWALVLALVFWLTRKIFPTRDQLVKESSEKEPTFSGSPSEKRKDKETASYEDADLPEDARRFLADLRQADVDIDDEEVSAKIREIERRTRQIFRLVKEFPSKRREIRRFMNYYLPTLIKLLSAYARLEKEGVDGENINRSMVEISRVLDTIISAFDKQLDHLYRNEALDISTDISVLESILKQEGLMDDNNGIS